MGISNLKAGKTTDSLLLKLLQDDFRPRLEKAVKKLSADNYTSMPFAMLVDLTTKCDLGCSWCIDKYVLSKNKEIPEKRMLKLLEEFKKAGIRSIVYFGGGEPMMYNKINEILTKTYNLGIDYAINTNGIMLERASETISKTCSWIRISLDSASEEKYKELHDGKNYFKKIVENIKILNKNKKGTVGTSFVVMENNVDEIFEAAKLIKKIGCDFIQFKPRYIPNIKNERSLTKYIANLNNRVKKELEKAKRLDDATFAVLITGSMETLLSSEPVNQRKGYTYCAAQQFVPLVTPYGVYVCPNLRGSEKGKIGDISAGSFKNIWESKQRKKIIKQINPSKDCKLACLRHQINSVINSIIENKKIGVDLLSLIKETKDNDISDKYFI
ncbi:MAG: radical SAM protein [Candidatus Moranbacteria bacterium]|nr:radical SAM protein [Candidatus Moranbacteria bacterium]